MNKIILTLFLAATLFCFGCKKKTCDEKGSGIVASSAEITEIQNYLSANSLVASEHSSGLFFFITSPGSGEGADLCSSVTVKYKGALLNGSVFDESTVNVSFPLKNLIIGWQKGIPLINKGGKIKLYVPPSLGYGNSGTSGIPGNSTLIFDIELVDVVK